MGNRSSTGLSDHLENRPDEKNTNESKRVKIKSPSSSSAKKASFSGAKKESKKPAPIMTMTDASCIDTDGTFAKSDVLGSPSAKYPDTPVATALNSESSGVGIYSTHGMERNQSGLILPDFGSYESVGNSTGTPKDSQSKSKQNELGTPSSMGSTGGGPALSPLPAPPETGGDKTIYLDTVVEDSVEIIEKSDDHRLGGDHESREEDKRRKLWPLLTDTDWGTIQKCDDITMEFTFHKKIGTGVSGTVWLVTKRSHTGTAKHKRTKYALKTFFHCKNVDLLFMTEYKFLSKLHLPGVIKIHGTYADKERLYILSEYGCLDLFRRIKRMGRLTERKSKKIIRNLLETVAILHSHNVVHRDIKPENIVFVKNEPLEPKLVDWADALIVKNDNRYNELCGTAVYLAPERWTPLLGWELKASDVYAIGITTYECVTGRRVFYGDTSDAIKKMILKNDWSFPRSIPLSIECRDFIRTLLEFNSSKRLTAMACLNHVWLQ